jgi:hypothetical protein
VLENKPKNTSIYLFALLFPFWTMIASIKYFKSSFARNLFWFACAFMGYIFVFNPITQSEADSTRIADSLITMHNNPVNFKTIVEYFINNENAFDIYQTLVTFVLSLFTGNSHYLFLVFAIVFGYFYSRNIWMVFNYIKTDNLPWYIWLLLVTLLLICPIWYINGGRMWVALHVFIYGLFSYYLRNDFKKLMWCALSVLFHFSFVIPLLIFIIYLIIPKKNLTFFFILFFISISISEINIQSFREKIVDILPTKLSIKADSYLNDDSVETVKYRNANYSQYLKITDGMSKYFMFILVGYFWINQKKLFQEKLFQNLLTLFLFYASIFEILSVIPSMGRFLTVSNLIFYTLLLLLLCNKTLYSEFQMVTKYLSILLILPILLSIRIGFEYYGVSLFYSNFISSYFFEDRQPLINLVKSLF